MNITSLHRRSLLLTAAFITALACCAPGSRADDGFGAAYAWGDNVYGQLNRGGALSRPVPRAVAGFPAGVAVVAAAAGGDHALALGSDGRVYAWGENRRGQLGDGTTASRSTPAAVTGFPDGISVTAISAGGEHSLALGSDGKVYAWGRNGYGQLGDGTTDSRDAATPVTGFPDGVSITVIAAGANHSLALGSDGRVYAWGDDRFGQLGDRTMVPKSTPVAITGFPYGVTVISVAAGGDRSLAIGSGGRVYGWGSDLKSSRNAPSELFFVGGGATVTAISAGALHAFAFTSDGRFYAWGANESGQLGDGSLVFRPGPVNVTGRLPDGATVTGFSAGGAHTLAQGSDGTLYAWGSNQYGQLGDLSAPLETAPVAVPDLPPGVTITAAAAGKGYSLAVGSDGQLYAWGRNLHGQLGVPTPAAHPLPGPVEGISLIGAPVSAVAAGISHSLAVTGEGALYAWGKNEYGQLGDGSFLDRFDPTPITGLPHGVSASSVAVGEFHSLALGSDGRVYAWGRNGDGQLGDGTNANRNAPVPVVGFPSGVSVRAIAAGESYSLAVGSDGKAYAWGYNAFGQLGDGTNANRNAPVPVTGLPDGVSVVAVSAGADHSLAVGSDGRVYAWGGNDEGQLGDGTNTAHHAPAPVVGLPAGTPVTAISAGSYFSLALCADGTLYGWGSNWTGQLGGGDTAERDIAAAISGFPQGVSVDAASAGRWHALAIGSDRKIYSWGNNRAGQLGDGTTIGRTSPAVVAGFPPAASALMVSAGADYSLSVETGLPIPVGLADVRQALRIMGGLTGATAADMDRLNVAVDGDSTGRIDILDTVRLLRDANGLEPTP